MTSQPVELRRFGDVLQLAAVDDRPGKGVGVELRELDLRGLRRMPLVRACGTPSGVLIDCTAGLGCDGWFLAAAGWTVVAIERSPLVHAVLEDGLRRAALDPGLGGIAARISLQLGDAKSLLPLQARGAAVIYLDPMYPAKASSALAPKAIRRVREVAGDDFDSAELLQVALGQNVARVVVKRPISSPPLAPAVHHHTEGKLARFDVYIPRMLGPAGEPKNDGGQRE